MTKIRLAIIGCGYVADFYMLTLANYPEAQVVRAFDIEPAHATRYAKHWNVPTVTDRAAFFDGLEADLVLNLTNPASHFEVSKACLEAGLAVYSEKPLAMRYEEIEELRAIAETRGIVLAGAPCNHLGEAAQAVRRAVDQGKVGRPLLAYAEMDDGLIARSPYQNWINVSGAPWPYEDEFEVGCTIEHAGYYLTWLIFLFGSITEVHAFSSLQNPGKPVAHAPEAPDFSVACLKFESGMVARLTCGVVGVRDHRFIVHGDEGLLQAEDCWFYQTPVTYKRWMRIRRRFTLSPWESKVPLDPPAVPLKRRGAAAMDFARGPIEVARAIREGRPSRLPLDFCVHFNEVSLAIHYSFERPEPYQVKSRCAPMAPLPSAHDRDARLSFLDRKLAPLLAKI